MSIAPAAQPWRYSGSVASDTLHVGNRRVVIRPDWRSYGYTALVYRENEDEPYALHSAETFDDVLAAVHADLEIERALEGLQ